MGRGGCYIPATAACWDRGRAVAARQGRAGQRRDAGGGRGHRASRGARGRVGRGDRPAPGRGRGARARERHRVRPSGRLGRSKCPGVRGRDGRALRPHRLPGQRGRADLPRHAARHHAGALRRAHRGEPARPVLPDAGRGGGHAAPRRTGHDREHRLHGRAGRAAVPGAIRGGEGRAFHGADDGWRERAAKTLPMGKLAQVDEIADFVVFLLSPRSGVVTGSVIDWDQQVLGGAD